MVRREEGSGVNNANCSVDHIRTPRHAALPTKIGPR
jgi:hypothetical protein